MKTSIDKIKKIRQKLIATKFMFKMSTTHMRSNDYDTAQSLP